jgi:hypothetical protein
MIVYIPKANNRLVATMPPSEAPAVPRACASLRGDTREETVTVYQILNRLRVSHGLRLARVPRPYIKER